MSSVPFPRAVFGLACLAALGGCASPAEPSVAEAATAPVAVPQQTGPFPYTLAASISLGEQEIDLAWVGSCTRNTLQVGALKGLVYWSYEPKLIAQEDGKGGAVLFSAPQSCSEAAYKAGGAFTVPAVDSTAVIHVPNLRNITAATLVLPMQRDDTQSLPVYISSISGQGKAASGAAMPRTLALGMEGEAFFSGSLGFTGRRLTALSLIILPKEVWTQLPAVQDYVTHNPGKRLARWNEGTAAQTALGAMDLDRDCPPSKYGPLTPASLCYYEHPLRLKAGKLEADLSEYGVREYYDAKLMPDVSKQAATVWSGVPLSPGEFYLDPVGERLIAVLQAEITLPEPGSSAY